MSTDREWIASELRRTLHALAAPGPEALAAVPNGSAKADELALDYDNFVHAFLDSFGSDLSPAQRHALHAVDAKLQSLSGRENAELWTENAVLNHPQWQSVRTLAADALAVLGWK